MKTVIEIDLGNWNPDDAEFQEYLKNAVVTNLARQLRDVHMNKVMDEVAKRCVAEAELLICASIRNLFNEAVLDGEGGEQTMQDMVRDRVFKWVAGKADSSYARNSHITNIDNLMAKIINEELTKESKEMLTKVKNEAIAQARKRISDVLAERLFDGKSIALL